MGVTFFAKKKDTYYCIPYLLRGTESNRLPLPILNSYGINSQQHKVAVKITPVFLTIANSKIMRENQSESLSTQATHCLHRR